MVSIRILTTVLICLTLGMEARAEQLQLALRVQPDDALIGGLHLALDQSPDAPVSVTLYDPALPDDKFGDADIIAGRMPPDRYGDAIHIKLGPRSWGNTCGRAYLDLHGPAHPDMPRNGTIAPWAYDLGGENDANQGFVELFHDRHGRLPDVDAAIGYDLGNLLLSTLNRATLHDREVFLATMLQADFISVRGELQFTAQGAPLHRQYLRHARQGRYGLAHSYTETLPDLPPASCEE